MSVHRACLGSLFVLACLVSACTACRTAPPKPCAAGDPTTITVEGVPAVCGKTAADPDVYTYQGIPFAEPPIGERRWQEPIPLDWPSGPALQRVAFGHKCAQPGLLEHAGSEDCLYLNVWTPKDAINGVKKLPVMVFIHGGAFIFGSGASPTFEGSHLAKPDGVNDGVVLVTLNYRLGAPGFLVADSKGSGPIGGNFALLDQQVAMTWVQNHIAHFGGDPQRITLFGESAGAISVGLHNFSMPSSQPLFNAALMESNPLGVTYRKPAEAVEAIGNQFMTHLCDGYNEHRWFWRPKCPDPGWLDHVTTQQVIHAQGKVKTSSAGFSPTLPWAPVVDGSLVAGEPYAGYAPGVTGRKPLGFGVNRNEGVLFAALEYKPREFTVDWYRAQLGNLFGPATAEKILAQQAYDPQRVAPASYYNNVAVAFANVTTDYVFTCGNVGAANAAAAAAGAGPVFGYYFTQPPYFDLYQLEGFDETHGACLPASGNVCHGDELPYVFGNLDAVAKKYKPTPGDVALAAKMTKAWADFAANPQAPAGWLAYDPNAKLVVQWNANAADSTPVDLDAVANCTSLWLGTTPYER